MIPSLNQFGMNVNLFGAQVDAQVVFRAPLLSGSGYADESRGFLDAAHQAGVRLKTKPLDTEAAGVIPPWQRHQILSLADAKVDPGRAVLYQATTADGLSIDYRYKYLIGRTMFESDRLPIGWAHACNAMDEVWVPSRFNVDTFISAGVKPGKLRLVPAGVDTVRYQPNLQPLPIPGRRRFNFLSVFEWQHRKGWDVLLRAFASAFHHDDDVSLTIKTSTRSTIGADPVGEMLGIIEGDLGKRLEEVPPIIVLEGYLAYDELPRLYASGDAFVLPSRGEGYGRPYMEAMACGLPTIGTRWGGQLDFMRDDNSYLIETERLAPVTPLMDYALYHGHRWAEPSAEDLTRQMVAVVRDKEAAAAKGQAARVEMVEHWDWEIVGRKFADELRRAVDN